MPVADDATLRPADPAADAAACAAIYAPYVTDGLASFEESAPDAAELARRIAAAHDWLVAERGGAVVGYAYTSAHHARAAYRWSVDVSVYLHAEHHRTGLGRALYTELLGRARAAGFRQACGGITLPNPGSVGLHEALGFVPVARYPRVGFKFGAWHDVGWWQLDLRPGDTSAPEHEPRPPAGG